MIRRHHFSSYASTFLPLRFFSLSPTPFFAEITLILLLLFFFSCLPLMMPGAAMFRCLFIFAIHYFRLISLALMLPLIFALPASRCYAIAIFCRLLTLLFRLPIFSRRYAAAAYAADISLHFFMPRLSLAAFFIFAIFHALPSLFDATPRHHTALSATPRCHDIFARCHVIIRRGFRLLPPCLASIFTLADIDAYASLFFFATLSPYAHRHVSALMFSLIFAMLLHAVIFADVFF